MALACAVLELGPYLDANVRRRNGGNVLAMLYWLMNIPFRVLVAFLARPWSWRPDLAQQRGFS